MTLEIRAHRISELSEVPEPPPGHHHHPKPLLDAIELVPAHQQRQWMNETTAPGPNGPITGIANRCLPLLMANQIGWNIVSTHSYVITSTPDGQMIFAWDGPPPMFGTPKNNFGHNIVTWPMPWVFETPPGWDLLLIPPPNYHMPNGVTVLSGLVETDHAHATFTLNWHIEPKTSVWVKKGDPIVTLLPYRTDELERFSLSFDEEVPPRYMEWSERRSQEIKAQDMSPKAWRKEYWNEAKRRKLKRNGTGTDDINTK